MIKSNIHILEKCNEVSKILKSLSHPVRLKILCQIFNADKTVCELAKFCKISQSSMSQFLGRMRAEGVIDFTKNGTTVYYRICNPKIYKMMQAIYKIYS
jgi:ArsR family transcriptional regulator, virulence genes transcriptional regulator